MFIEISYFYFSTGKELSAEDFDKKTKKTVLCIAHIEEITEVREFFPTFGSDVINAKSTASSKYSIVKTTSKEHYYIKAEYREILINILKQKNLIIN